MAPLVGVLSAKGEKRGVLGAITRAPIAFLLSFLEFDCVGNLHLFFSLSRFSFSFSVGLHLHVASDVRRQWWNFHP